MTQEEKRDAMDLLDRLYDENLDWSDAVRIVATALREAEARALERFLTEVKRICESDDFISYRMSAVENFVRAALAQHDALRAEAEKERTP